MGSWHVEYMISETEDATGKPLRQKILRMRKHGPTGAQVFLVTHVFDKGMTYTDTVQLTGKQMDEVVSRWEDFKGVKDVGS